MNGDDFSMFPFIGKDNVAIERLKIRVKDSAMKSGDF